MKFPELTTLETSRLRLRKITMTDTENYFRHSFGSEAVARYMLWDPHRDISESEASIRKVLGRYEAGRCYRWAIALRETDALIGIIELLRFDEETANCSFAYMLGEPFWGKGFGTEALCAAFRFAFTQMDIKAITADHMAENPASGRVMEKAGMKKVRLLPGKYEKHGRTYDAVEYTVTAEQWHDRTGAAAPQGSPV